MQRLLAPRSRHGATLRLFLTCCVALGLFGCQTLSGQSAGTSNLRSILASNQLRVGLTGDQPPLNMRNQAGEIIGLDVDLMEALAQSMGLEAVFVAMPFAELLTALERGDVDVIASSMTITPERNARVAFAGPYYISGKSVLTKSRDIADTMDLDRLGSSNRSFAALEGSTSERFVRDSMPQARLVTTQSTESAIAMVINDEVDAMVGDVQVCTFSAWSHPEVELHTSISPFTIEPLGIALPADSPLLINLVQNYLKALETTGMLSRFKAKWLTDGPWIDELP
jgi:polar amino acid transport system substrate-binding protein